MTAEPNRPILPPAPAVARARPSSLRPRGRAHRPRAVSGRPDRRARARRPAGRGHLIAFAIAVPAAGAAGAIAAASDTVSTAAAAVLPLAVFLGVMIARVLFFRMFAWAWAALKALTGRRGR